jgi:peptidoglycan/xylan/chitin deacetylase (PgdA/CDA1 family)
MTDGPSAILTYHSLDETGSVISTPPAVFRRQMEFLAGSGIPVVPLDQVSERPGGVAITFDDGFSNLLDHALPVLERFGLPATVFVVSGYCGGRNNWPTQPTGAVPDLPLMSWDQLRHLPPAISPGAHTRTHPHLSRLPAEECERELLDCRAEMEQRLGRPVKCLAYPYGSSTPPVRSLAKRHFDVAVGTYLGFLPAAPDRLDLPRIDTYYLRGRFPLDRLFTTPGAWYIRLRAWMREIRRQSL